MKKLKMIVTSVVVLAIVGSAFAFNAKKIGKFCYSVDINTTSCTLVNAIPSKRVPGTNNHYYVVNWDGVACSSSAPVTCTTSAFFTAD
jgi:hypothetical protein